MPEPVTRAELTGRLAALPAGARHLVAVAAPPGAGKSTLAASLAADLGAEAAIVPMDGFHLDNVLLDARGLRPRKGAPETFDAAGLAALIRRLKAEPEVVYPVFDRERDLAVAGAGLVEPHHRIVLVEGNYLLLDRRPWDALAPLWDLTVSIDTPLAELERRLVARWRHHGLDEAAARARALGNDIPNARLVLEASRPADLVLVA